MSGGKKILMFFVSVIISLSLWLFVNLEENPIITKDFSNIPVVLLNEEEYTKLGYTYSVEENDSVNITVQGRSKLLSSLSPSDFKATADFKQLSEMNAMPVIVTSKFEDNIDITVNGSGMVLIKSEKKKEVKKPVTVKLSGKLASGFVTGKEVTTAPNMVTISGPKSVVDSIEDVRTTVDVSGISDSVSLNGLIKIYDKEDEEIVNTQIEITPKETLVTIPILKKKSVPIILVQSGQPKEGYKVVSFQYAPKEIEVIGDDSVIDKLERIDLGSVSIDGKSKTYESNFIIKNSMLPEGVYMQDENEQLKIQCEIKKEK